MKTLTRSLDADEDMLTALARELVEKGKVGESAEAVWRDLDRERSKHTAEQPLFVEVSSVSPSVSLMIAAYVDQDAPDHRPQLGDSLPGHQHQRQA